ncbi:GIY-YIG nuclease family protein [Sediminibacterium ginsengisoli]|uniref:GIY-YIG catalytic domain-containing protein n=1 Tax=Sediminibacterium ginsengisoli TaxID=413434 RepID=A0A1T4JPH8_9BACT|nr:GIY-YIG nuclease family protein [Sediminibacterium ginsengisoli]SJZ32084.1 GIY-YIG catalytic domain-containing protein [Sediminibacterium ginsengisoli]
MTINELTPKPTVKLQFKLVSFKTVPQENGCYILTTFDNTILYIGLATNLNKRFKQHLDNPEKTNPTSEGKAIWFYFTTFDPRNLQKLERTWLNQFSDKHGRLPILNKVNSPIG